VASGFTQSAIAANLFFAQIAVAYGVLKTLRRGVSRGLITFRINEKRKNLAADVDSKFALFARDSWLIGTPKSRLHKGLGTFRTASALFCRAWMAFVSFRSVRGLIVFFPFLKFIIAHLATPDCRERLLVENCIAPARI
jgi:hypothetical protein